jgi:hypothetical protein
MLTTFKVISSSLDEDDDDMLASGLEERLIGGNLYCLMQRGH